MSPSSGKSAASLHLIVERSTALATLLVAAHSLALMAALANPLDIKLKLLLIGAVLLSFSHHLRMSNRIYGLTLTSGGDWEVLVDGQAILGQLEPGTIVTPWIVILHLRLPSHRLALPVCRDATDPESFRQLRVHLRLSRPVSGLASD